MSLGLIKIEKKSFPFYSILRVSILHWKGLKLACERTRDRSRPTPKIFLKWTELDFSGQFYSAPQLQVTTFTLLLPRAFIYLSKKKIKNMFFLCSHGSIFRHSLCSYKQPRNLFWTRSCNLSFHIQFELQNIIIGDQNETFLVIFKYCGN